MNYIFLPDFNDKRTVLCEEYKEWLGRWLYQLNENIERESISSSECVQGLLCEELMGKRSTDWASVERDLLRDEDGRPMAYSREYGKKLYQFDSQWKQMPVYAIYNSFWINQYYGKDISIYRKLIVSLIQSDGWIYNPDVSNTQIRTRMKSELMMSMAMGTSILLLEGMDDAQKNKLEAALASVPLTGYVGAEFFRKIALENIQRICQFPDGIEDMLKKCEAGHAYNDFCVEEKIDDYMGTRKRTQHDHAIHTPLATCMAMELWKLSQTVPVRTIVPKMKKYADTLRKKPLDIPAFTMRDIAYPFGTGISPLEIIAAAIITNAY